MARFKPTSSREILPDFETAFIIQLLIVFHLACGLLSLQDL